MAIYNRDNFAALNDAALANALARRQAAVDRAAQRRTGNFEAIGRALPVFGRTAEEGMVPDQYRDDPEYRAARFDYIYGGDRSGLDSFRQARAAREEAEKQRAFQAQEAALNRAMQEREGAANRALQREQHGLSKITEKAKMLRDYNTYNDIIDDIDSNTSAYGARAGIERAKAVNNRDMQKALMRSSGLFTPEELGDKPAGTVQVQPSPDAAPAAAQEATQEETPKKFADWMKQEPLIVSAIKGRDWDGAEKLMGELNPDDRGLQKDVGKYRDQVAAGRKADAAAAADIARHQKLAENVKDSDLNTAVLEGKTSFTGTVDGKSVTFDIKLDNSNGEHTLVYKGKVYKRFDPYNSKKK